jgi:hypothetical protein
MKQIAMIAFVAGALCLAGCGKKEAAAPAPPKPSRAAADGCEWAAFEAKALGVSLLYEKCQDGRFSLAEEGNAVVLRRAGEDAPRTIVEVFTKREMQPAEGAIREQFISLLSDKERLGCAVTPSPRMRLQDVRTYEIVPGPQYAAEAAKLREKEPAAAVCGSYGDSGGLRFFLYQPEATKIRFAFVDASLERAPFDETSVRLLPDSVADAAVRDLPITSLPLAERYAAGVEGRLDKLAKKTGQFLADGKNVSWAAFRDGGQIVLIVELSEQEEDGSASIRYFFRDGRLALVREASLGPAPAVRSRGAQQEILQILAFTPEGRLAGGRRTVSGKGEEVSAAAAESAAARAAELLKRVQGS